MGGGCEYVCVCVCVVSGVNVIARRNEGQAKVSVRECV
jgi:hypothetical protein